MKHKKFLSKIVSLGLALTLTCNMFPMQNLLAEEKTGQKEQESEAQEEEEKENGEPEKTAKEAVREVIEINTADDFRAFADQCSLDSWSADKRVLLNEDIDLTDMDFDAIQVFTGIFDGQGHTISGFRYQGDGYVAGLFRYIEKDGLVENLKLKGEVIASDEKECIGGLCGVNYGTIENCSFQGTVSGRTTVGGLVGVNEGTGVIRKCFAGGRVTGYYSTGGLAGKNHGIVSSSINRACINNDNEWVEEDDEMGVGLFLSINVSESDTELFSGVDAGGIAGYSDGMITRCTNYGKVGYEHTGYNIGGIAGRQSGVVSYCTNSGTVYGRKDVGGVIGQMEPYIEVDEAASLRNAVNRLHDLIEKTIDDMENGKNVIKGDLDELAVYSDGAADAGDALAGQITDFVDSNMDQAQAVTDRLEHVMDMLPEVFDDVFAAEDSFSDANRALMQVVEELKDVGNIEGEYVETDYNRLTLLSTVGGNMLSLQHYPEAGETVHIMVEPNAGYGLDHIEAVDANGNGIDVQQEEERRYTFVMPEPNVRVEAYFGYQDTDSDEEEEPSGDDGGEKSDGAANPSGNKGEGEADASGNKVDGTVNPPDDTGNGAADSPGNGGTAGPSDNKGNGAADASDNKGNGAADTSGDKTEGSKPDGTTDASGNPSDGAPDGSDGKGDAAADASDGKTDGAADASDGKTDGAADVSDGKTDGAADVSGDKTDGAPDASGGGTDSTPDASGDVTDGGPDNGSGSGGDSQNQADDGAGEGNGETADNRKAGVNRFGYTPVQLMGAGTGTFAEVKLLASEAGLQKDETISDTEDAPETGDTIVKLSSNLSGNASCEIDGGTATLIVIPDGAYTVSGTPSVTVDGQAVSVSRSGESDYAYTFDVSGGVCQVNITFRKQDKSQTVNGAKGDISSAIKEQQAAAEKVNAIIKEIQGSSGVTQDQLDELTKALEEMSGATSAVLSSMSVVSNIVGQHALEKIEATGEDMAEALNHLQSAVDSVKSATRDAKSIVDYVNGQQNIRFSKLGGEFEANRKELHDQLKGMSGSIKSLSNNASDYSDVVNDDLRAVNDQINIIFNLMADNWTNYIELSMEELYEDIDTEDTAGISTGKSENCTNKGIVKGDINVGGIAGSMSIDEEDPEDSAAGSIDYQIGRRYFTKCIITGGVNEGHVSAKKDGAGGIVGYMRHGIVVDSEGYGSVESTEGDYAGGICGESFTVIKRCYALCSVSGGRNVGGIAGFADTLKDCYAVVDCNATIGRKGAIAGQTVNYDDALNEEEVKVSNNYYVGDNLYGIDNISYTGIAEPISYEELLTVMNLPTQFRHLKVTFRVDDLYLGEQEVGFGESLAGLDYPAMPTKEGYYGVWPDCSDRVMTGNLLIRGEYKEDVTVVQSEGSQKTETEGEREKPYALVEQRFTEDTVLHAVLSDREPPEKAHGKEYVLYDITLENAQIREGDTFAVRLLNPYKEASVWGCKDDVWTELESKMRGQYLQVDMTGTEQTFCIMERSSGTWMAMGYAAGVLIALILIAVLVKKVSAKHTKNRVK